MPTNSSVVTIKHIKRETSSTSPELKVFVVIFNIFYMGASAGLIYAGVDVLLDNEGMVQLSRIENGVYTDMTTSGLLDVAAVMTITVGVGLFAMACLALWGICQESKCLLALYICGLIVLALGEAAIFVCSVLMVERVQDDLRDALDQGIRFQFEGHLISEVKFSKALDEAQIQFECCGLDNYTDFKNYAINWNDRQSLEIPKSCCKLDSDAYFGNNQYVFDDINCAQFPDSTISNIDKACYTDIKDWLKEKSYVMLGVAIAGFGIELMGVWLTSCLLRDFGSTKA